MVKFMTMNTEQQFTYNSSNETFEDFQNKVIESIPHEWSEYKGVKFIFAGVVINRNNFHTVPDKSVLMTVCTKTLEQSVTEPPHATCVEVESPQTSRTSQTSQTSRTSQTSYSIDTMYISAITFMAYVRENPSLCNMFNLNFNGLMVELRKGEFKDIYSQILNNSDKLLENGEITLEITGNNGTGNVNEIILDDQDNSQINIIISMGFEKNMVIDAYIKNNKDVNSTLNYLMK